MTDAARRKELKAQYQQTPPEAGVYLIVNNQTGRSLLSSTTDLPSIQSKIDFGRSTKSPGVLGYALRPDIQQYGIESFSLEILETLEVTPEMTREEIKRDLATLEQLWDEKLGDRLRY